MQVSLGLMFVLSCLASWHRYQVWQDKEQQHLAIRLAELETGYRGVVNMFGLATEIYFQGLINRPEIIDLMAVGLHGEREARDLARASLYRLLSPNYKLMQSQGIYNFHFHSALLPTKLFSTCAARLEGIAG